MTDVHCVKGRLANGKVGVGLIGISKHKDNTVDMVAYSLMAEAAVTGKKTRKSYLKHRCRLCH